MQIKIRVKKLVWEKEGIYSWIAFNGWDGPFQIDYLPEVADDGNSYFAQRNSFGDCEGDNFSSLDAAKAYCQELQDRDVKTFLDFIDITVEQPDKVSSINIIGGDFEQ